MHYASMIVDFTNVRCGGCKVLLQDELVRECPTCGAMFDRITSNHVGLDRKLLKAREQAGIKLAQAAGAGAPAAKEGAEASTSDQSPPAAHTASIVVDLLNARCGGCKVLLQDELVDRCPTCGAVFDRVTSNHVGLADKLKKLRDQTVGT